MSLPPSSFVTKAVNRERLVSSCTAVLSLTLRAFGQLLRE